jgi:hypothetical protein
MEERTNQTSALCTTLSACESIGLLLKIDDDMASADNPTILARTPYDFYRGENCQVVGTLHNIVSLTSDMHACCVERRRLINSGHHRKHMCFRPEQIKSQSSPLHAITQMLCTDSTVKQLLPPYKRHVFWAQLFHCHVSSQHVVVVL